MKKLNWIPLKSSLKIFTFSFDILLLIKLLILLIRDSFLVIFIYKNVLLCLQTKHALLRLQTKHAHSEFPIISIVENYIYICI